MCVMNVIPSLRGRQGMLDLEDLELEDPDICFAGGNRHDNELLKLTRKFLHFLRKIFG